jgi:hypothetical protein
MNEQEKKQDNLIKDTPEVDPAEEKDILGLLSQDAASFVPDKEQQILAEAHVDASVDQASEKEILSLLGKEADAFVPNDLTAIQKATGTYNPRLSRDELAIKEKVANEGREIVPDVKDEVYAETGAKTHFSFWGWTKKHAIALSASLVVVIAGATTGIVLAHASAKVEALSTTYLSVSVTPSSAVNSGSTYGLYTGTTTSNTYKPAFSFQADSANYVNKTTLASENYSASLASSTLAADELSSAEAPSFVSKLLPCTYRSGYLETLDETRTNVITINYISTDPTYESTYAESYKKSISSYLSSNHIYASLKFVNAASGIGEVSAFFEGVDAAKAEQAVKTYWLLGDEGSYPATDYKLTAKSYLSYLRDEDDEILSALNNAIAKGSNSPLSPAALTNVKGGLALSYARYKNNYATSTSADLSKLKEELADIRNVTHLPWVNRDNVMEVQEALLHDSYYLVNNPAEESVARSSLSMDPHIEDSDDALGLFFRIRDGVTSSLTKQKYLALLNEAAERAETAPTTPGGLFPDGQNGEMPDPGGHHHGDGGWDGGGLR